MADQPQSDYYQAVAREFLRLRGAPFFLSPRDLAVISGWEEEGVPLDVILEGIGRAFETARAHSRARRPSTLVQCQAQVRKAMAQHVDRRAGRRRKEALPRSEKAGRVRAEIESFLRRPPAGGDALRPLFEAALGHLARPSPDEVALEKIDEDVDQALWDRVPQAEREAQRRKMARELAGRGPAEAAAAVRIRLVKAARAAGKVPFVSLFYY